MKTLLTKFGASLAQYADYLRTKREIENMPLETSFDLGIDRFNARKIARTAVYG